MIEVKLSLDVWVQAYVEVNSITDGYKKNAFKIWKPRKNSRGKVVLNLFWVIMYLK